MSAAGSPARRVLFLLVPYAAFALALGGVEAAVRATRPRLLPLDFFVTAPEQRAQLQDARRLRIFEGDPLLCWRLAPGLRDVVWDQTPVTTNAQGLRYDRDVGRKAAGAFRILCLGDSVTFGFRVPLVFLKRPQERDPAWRPYPARMEAWLRAANPGRAVEVIPLAVPGYSSHQGRAWLARDARAYAPDLVILLFGWNDISLRARSDEESMPTGALQVMARGLVSRSQALMYAWRGVHSPPAAAAASGGAVPRVARDRFVENHLRMAEAARAAGAAVVVVGPVFRDAVEHPDEAARMGEYRAALREAMRRGAIPYLEVPELTEAGWPANEKLFLEHIHPDHAGHRVLARALLAFLADQGLLGGLAPAGENGP
jgi:lysophospholipase L1-like esterase